MSGRMKENRMEKEMDHEIDIGVYTNFLVGRTWMSRRKRRKKKKPRVEMYPQNDKSATYRAESLPNPNPM